MILKYKTGVSASSNPQDGGYTEEASWRYIDNIVDVEIVKKVGVINPETATVNYSKIWGVGGDTARTLIESLVLVREAYLLNDNGKTIERII